LWSCSSTNMKRVVYSLLAQKRFIQKR
jgi:hypothetical protein